MRRNQLLTSFSLLAAVSACAQTQGQLYTASREQLDVTKIVLAQENAWNKGDLDGYLAQFKDAPDTEAILNGPVRGIANIRTAYHNSFPDRAAMGTLEQSNVEVRELGPDFALALGHYRLQRGRKNGGDAEGNFTEIFQKTEQGWKLIFAENT
jgi:uncharacterized protein (TIGR02246 family)